MAINTSIKCFVKRKSKGFKIESTHCIQANDTLERSIFILSEIFEVIKVLSLYLTFPESLSFCETPLRLFRMVALIECTIYIKLKPNMNNSADLIILVAKIISSTHNWKDKSRKRCLDVSRNERVSN